MAAGSRPDVWPNDGALGSSSAEADPVALKIPA
jgi:hypothetical protein